MSKPKMTYGQAYSIVGSFATWELKGMIRALNMLYWLNTPEGNQRLTASKVVLAYRNRQSRDRKRVKK